MDWKTALKTAMEGAFASIDFETANKSPGSACALALVRVERLEITAFFVQTIKPPNGPFVYTDLHGIGPETVEQAEPFPVVWQKAAPLLEGVAFLAAHHASFDRRVLHSCCRQAGIRRPQIGFLCTERLAKKVWGWTQGELPEICQRLNLDLRHHDPLSDATACARIVTSAVKRCRLDGLI